MRALELHAHAKQVQRSKGQSSVAAAAYRAGEKLHDERTNITHDYTRKQGVEFKRIYLPENAPQNYKDRGTLWNVCEKKENRSNSFTAHELEVGFPYEFNAMQRREAGDKIVRNLMRRYGCAVDICYHAPNRNNDERNFHAHILFTSRGFDSSTKDGWAKTKFRDLSDDPVTINGKKSTRGKQEVLSLRQFTADAMNTIAKRDGLSVKVEHLSFKKRSIDKEPQIHLGARANDMKKQGLNSERDTQNNNIIKLNQKIEDKRKQVQGVQYDDFDEYAGARLSELQQWKWDTAHAESRRCDGENRKLEKKLFNTYGENESIWRAEIANLKSRISTRGASGAYRKVTGRQKDDLEQLKNLQKNLKSAEIGKKYEKDKLLNQQNNRREQLEKQYAKAEQKVREEIMKSRSLFQSGKSEGKDGNEDSRSISPVKSTTYEKVKAKLLEKQKANQNASRSTSDRKPSYSGSDIKYKQSQRLKSKHSEATKRDGETNRKRKSANPEFDYSPPRGPSHGR